MDFVYTDFDRLKASLQDWGLDFVQLGSGPLRAHLRTARIARVSVFYFKLNRAFHQRGTAPRDGRSFGLFAGEPTDLTWRNRKMHRHALTVLPRNGDFDAFSVAGFEIFGITIESAFLEQVAELCGLRRTLDRLPDGGDFFLCRPETLQTVRRSAQAALRMPDGFVDAELEFEIAGNILRALAGGAEPDPPPRMRKRDAAFDAAVDLLKVNGGKGVAIPELCRAVGVSERTLRYAFEERIGISPKKYALTVKLNRLRSEFLKADPRTAAIAEIAAEYGIWHIGQLGIDYKRLFGELPSETIRRFP